jgi:hypothetical protein
MLGRRTLFSGRDNNRRIVFGALVLLAATAACDDRSRTRRVPEEFTIVPGTPQVDAEAPKVLEDPTRATDHFAINVPRQCDLFQQLSVRKVDILWVVDSSGSMAPKQMRLAQNFQGFMNQLVGAQPPIDFQIAVTTTDTDNPATRGKLRDWSLGGGGGNFIACVPDASGATSTCNTGSGSTQDAVTAFAQMAQVGTSGSATERGLLAAYLALTNDENLSTASQARFVRPDAALYVVVVSDEDDASCNPMSAQPVCTADPGCRCAPDATLSGPGAYGSAAYFSRFLETYKGYGNQDMVALAAIVALDDQTLVPSQFGDPNPHVGCCKNLAGGVCPTSGTNDGTLEIAYYGGRYKEVAARTGGVAVSICDEDFSGALASLGYAASGLRREFRLTRGPELSVQGSEASGLALFVSPANAANCAVDGNCPTGQVCRSGRCAERIPVQTVPAANGAQYVQCEASTFRNIIRFDGTAVPESLSAIEVCYDVAPNFQMTCL